MNKKPAYLQIYETLRRELVDGLWPRGSRLPSKRDLADRFGVSVITAEHAYALLAEEGYVELRQRSGCYAAYRETDGFSQPPEPAAPLPPPPGVQTDDTFPFSVYAKTTRWVLSEYGQRLLDREENLGCGELRTAMSRYLAQNRHMEVRPEQIVVGAGAEYLYGLLVRLLGRDRIYAIEDPSYKKIRQVYEADGVRCRLLPLGRDGIQSRALTETDAQVLHITPYRSFPSGVTASAAKKREYLRWADKCGGVLIEDDCEAEFTLSSKPEETVFSLDGDKGRVVYLNTFSRTISPSVRIAYLVLPPALLETFEEKLGFYSCTVPTLNQYVLARLLESGEYQRHLNRIRRQLRRAL